MAGRKCEIILVYYSVRSCMDMVCPRQISLKIKFYFSHLLVVGPYINRIIFLNSISHFCYGNGQEAIASNEIMQVKCSAQRSYPTSTSSPPFQYPIPTKLRWPVSPSLVVVFDFFFPNEATIRRGTESGSLLRNFCPPPSSKIPGLAQLGWVLPWRDPQAAGVWYMNLFACREHMESLVLLL